MRTFLVADCSRFAWQPLWPPEVDGLIHFQLVGQDGTIVENGWGCNHIRCSRLLVIQRGAARLGFLCCAVGDFLVSGDFGGKLRDVCAALSVVIIECRACRN